MVVAQRSHLRAANGGGAAAAAACRQAQSPNTQHQPAHNTYIIHNNRNTTTTTSKLNSTLVGDVAEVKAIKKVFTDTSHVKMNATKSLIGHCLGAAAGIEAVAVVKAIQTGWLHPTLNQHNLVDEVAGIDTVPNEKKALEVTAACSNSFGFGGHNSAVIFAPFKG